MVQKYASLPPFSPQKISISPQDMHIYILNYTFTQTHTNLTLLCHYRTFRLHCKNQLNRVWYLKISFTHTLKTYNYTQYTVYSAYYTHVLIIHILYLIRYPLFRIFLFAPAVSLSSNTYQTSRSIHCNITKHIRIFFSLIQLLL